MRIISGICRGKRLFLPKDKSTRPLKDIAKESIFNVINHSKDRYININNSSVLDLFSGVGSFGLECFSRGAKYVTFVEEYDPAVSVLRKNIALLGASKKTKILKNNVFKVLDKNELDGGFDLIFIDPPFKEEQIQDLFKKIFKSKILKKNSLVVIHRNTKQVDNFPKNFKIFLKKIYGNSKIIFGYFSFNNF